MLTCKPGRNLESFSTTATRRAPASKIERVMPPGPGPTSSTQQSSTDPKHTSKYRLSINKFTLAFQAGLGLCQKPNSEFEPHNHADMSEHNTNVTVLDSAHERLSAPLDKLTNFIA